MAEGRTQQAHGPDERLRRLCSLALTLTGGAGDVFDRIAAMISEVFGFRAVAIERVVGERLVPVTVLIDGSTGAAPPTEVSKSPAAEVARAGALTTFTDAARRFPAYTFLGGNQLEYYAGFPVAGDSGQVIAVIGAMHGSPIQLAESDLPLIEALASRVRLELEREGSDEEAEALRTLLHISREVSRVRDLQGTLQMLVERARQALGVEIAAVATLDGSEGTTSWKAVSGAKTDAFERIRFNPGRGTAGRAISARGTVLFEGIGESPDLPAEEFPIHMAEGVRNALGVPLMVGEKIAGVLIAGYRSGLKFDEKKIKLAEGIAAQAAIAVENARLFSELTAANQRLIQSDRLKTGLIQELSTPVIPIWERVLFVPLVGPIDRNRAEHMMEALLRRAAEVRAEAVILDVTGVRTIDTDAAQHLRNVVEAVRVLGARAVITGIGAPVARTLVQLGIDLETITTRRRLSDGLQLALDMLRENRRPGSDL